MHFAFVADVLGIRDWPLDVVARQAHHTLLPEPVTLMAALSAVTSQIGLIATASTTFAEPYSLARQFASLDLLSGGRAGWNVVTSSQRNEAANFGRDALLAHEDRYERANEFVEVVRGLWATVSADILVGNKHSGTLYDAEGFRPLHHEGDHFRVNGILTVPPSPQGHPLIVQAGASLEGRQLAAANAELIFASTPSLAIAREYYDDIKGRAAALGRDPRRIAITPGFVPIIGSTEEEAKHKRADLDALLHPSISLTILGDILGNVDLSRFPLDGPLPDASQFTGKSKTLMEQIVRIAGEEKLTIGQAAARIATAHVHARIAGSPEQVADMMEHWFLQQACDGFLVFPFAPGELSLFVDEVLPILRQRGLFQDDYRGSTLRGNLFNG